MATSIDPKNEQLHRVSLTQLVSYKDGVSENVTAVCGKTWAPTIPLNRMREFENCPICFPNEEHRFGIAK